MAFDIDGARSEGYTDAEIADFLGRGSNFDVAGARSEGYGDADIIAHLSRPATPAPAPTGALAREPAPTAQELDTASRPARAVTTRGGRTLVVPESELQTRDNFDAETQGEQRAPWTGEDGVLTNAPGALVAGTRRAMAGVRRMGAEESIAQRLSVLDANTGDTPEGAVTGRVLPGALDRQRTLLAQDHARLQDIVKDAERAAGDLKAVTPHNMNTGQQAVWSVVQSAPPTLVGIGVGILTRNPILAMAIAGGGGSTIQAGSTYEEARAKGASHRTSAVAATIDGILEGVGEALPLKVALRPGTPIMTRIYNTMMAEAGQEAATQAMQDFNAYLSYNPEITFKEAWQNLKVAALAGAMGGAVYGTAGAVAESRRERALDLQPDKATDVLTGQTVDAGAAVEQQRAESQQPAPQEPTSMQLAMQQAMDRQQPQAESLPTPIGTIPDNAQNIGQDVVKTDQNLQPATDPATADAVPVAKEPAMLAAPLDERDTDNLPVVSDPDKYGRFMVPAERTEKGVTTRRELLNNDPGLTDSQKEYGWRLVGEPRPASALEATEKVKDITAIEGKSVVVTTAAQLEDASARVNTEPTEAQKEAGNYAKGHIKLQGLDIAIENPRGSVRTGKNAAGEEWQTEMPAAYGYVKRTEGKDGDQVDVYIGPKPKSRNVFVVDQIDPTTGKFDEHKALIGFATEEEALSTYEKAFSDGSAKSRIGAVNPMGMGEFRAWVKKGNTKKPISYKHVSPAQKKANAERAKRAKTVDSSKDTLLTAVAKLGGIDIGSKLDITGDTKGNKRFAGIGSAFSPNGLGVDEMATQLAQYGYMTPQEMEDVDGGVQALRDKVREEYDGIKKHYSGAVSEKMLSQEREAEAQAREEAEAAGATNPTAEEVETVDLVAKAVAQDPDGFERLAVQYEGRPDAEFRAALEEFIDAADNRKNEATDSRRQEAGGAPSRADTAEEVGAPKSGTTVPTAKTPAATGVAGPDGLFVQLGNRRYPVSSLEEASTKFSQARDTTVQQGGGGMSSTPQPLIVDANGKTIGYISYNGKVWAGDPKNWKSGAKPLYDNSAPPDPEVDKVMDAIAAANQRGDRAAARRIADAWTGREGDTLEGEATREPLNLTGQTNAEIVADEQRKAAAEITAAAESLKKAADAVRETFSLAAPSGTVSAQPLSSPKNQRDLLQNVGTSQQVPTPPVQESAPYTSGVQAENVDALTELGFKKVPPNVWALTIQEPNGSSLFNVTEGTKGFRVTVAARFKGGVTGAPSRVIGIYPSMEEAARVLKSEIDSLRASGNGAMNRPLASRRRSVDDAPETPEQRIIQQWSVEPDAVPVKQWAGRVVFHGTDTDGADSVASGISMEKSQKGYFGRGFYVASDYELARSNYADFGREDEPGKVIAIKIKDDATILDLRDAEDFERYQSISKNGSLVSSDNFDSLMRRAGVDGLFDRSFGGVVIYNPSAVEPLRFGNGRALFSRAPASGPAGPRLAVSHNLSAENLIFADKMGGLAVPSLGVTTEDRMFYGMGDITLIGRKDLGDPAAVDVFDADAYSPTFPRAEYDKVKTAVAQKLVDRIRPFSEKMDERNAIDNVWDNAVNNPNPYESINRAIRSRTFKAMFLDAKGVAATVAMKDADVQFPWIKFLDWEEFRRVVPFNDERDMETKERSFYEVKPLLKQAIDRYLHQTKDGRAYLKIYDKDEARAVLASSFGLKGDWINNDESMPSSLDWKFHESHQNVGKRVVDSVKTEKRLDDKLKGMEVEFKSWVESQIMPMYGYPFLKVGGKKRPFTLSHIVDAMTGRVRAQERTMTFGEGKARAVASKKFDDLEQMRRYASENMADEETISAARDEAKAAMESWRNSVVNYYGEPSSGREFGRVWEGLDASMRAIAGWARGGKTEANLRRALAREGFRTDAMPSYLLEDGVEAGKLFLRAPVPYFEAKPQRAVDLREFSGAVIPKNAPDQVRAILTRHGIKFKEYNSSVKDQREAQKAAVIQFRKELAKEGQPVLFSRRAPTGEDNAASTAFTLLAENDDFFRYPRSEAKSLREIVADIDPDLKVIEFNREQLAAGQYGPKVVRVFEIHSPSGGPADMAELVQTSDREVWLNIASYGEGRGGSAVYAAVANYAHNNNLTFIGDPNGLSLTALYRRTEAMLSSALKFGTTRHLEPHERQREGDEDHGVKPMSWRVGDDVFNLKSLLQAAYDNVESGLPEIADIGYNFTTQRFEDANGDPVTDAAFEDIARGTDGARSTHAGSSTLKRAALAGTLLRQGGGEGWRGVLGAVLRQSGEQLDPALRRLMYSRGPAKAGLSASGMAMRDIEAVVNRVRAGYKNLPPLRMMTSPARLDPAIPTERALADYIAENMGTDGIEGAFHDGTVYLFADNIADEARAEHVLLEHELFHYGIRGVFGRNVDPILNHIYMTNPAIREKAAAFREQHGIDSNVEATEEILAEMPSSELVKVRGWDRFLMFVRDWLAKNGFDRLAKAINDSLQSKHGEQGAADLFVADMIQRSRAWARTGQQAPGTELWMGVTKMSDIAPVFYSELSRSLQAVNQKAGTAEQWKGIIRNLKGVKSDEIEWSGVNEWLDTQAGRVEKADIASFLAQNGVRVEETMLGGGSVGEQERAVRDMAVRLDAMGYTVHWTPDGDGVDNVYGRKERETYFFGGSPDGDLKSINDIPDASARALAQEIVDSVYHVEDNAGTKYDTYTLPGGQNYRELLLTLPEAAPAGEGAWRVTDPKSGESKLVYQFGDLRGFRERGWTVSDEPKAPIPAFRSGHFTQPNILAHVRFDERTDAEGRRVLFVEEFQSDWAQKGKREGFGEVVEHRNWHIVGPAGNRLEVELTTRPFASKEDAESALQRNEDDIIVDEYKVEQRTASFFEGVPKAPFVTKTESWVALAMKRMIRYAADNGFDRIAWTTGEQQVDRYDLSKHIGMVRAAKLADGDYAISAYGKRGGDIPGLRNRRTTAKELPDVVGKDLADKIINGEGGEFDSRTSVRTYTGLDLKIGGEGMRTFYDRIVQNVANDLLKKLGGGRIGTVTINATEQPPSSAGFGRENPATQPGFDLTPAMRQKARSGLPMFSRTPVITENERAEAVNDAGKGIGSGRVEFIGEDVGDINAFQKYAVYPRTIAAFESDFTPVYQTAESQFETRDRIASELGRMAESYFDLTDEERGKVDAVLELGRLKEAVLAGKTMGMENTGQRAILSKPGDTVTLSDKEKSAYWAVRKMFDHALDMFQAQALRDFGIDPSMIRGDAREWLVNEAKKRSGKERDYYMAAADIADAIQDARRKGYIPFARFGDIVISVKDATGATLWVEKVETGTIERTVRGGAALERIPSVKAALDAVRQRFAGERVEIRAFKAPQSIPMEGDVKMADLDMLAEIAKVDNQQWEGIRDQLGKALQARGFRKHFLGSQNIPGYSTDFERGIADYIIGLSGYLSRRQHADLWDSAIAGIDNRKPRLMEYAQRYRDYVNDPQEEWFRLRQAGFAMYIAGVPASAAVNLTQVPLMTAPYLAQFIGPQRVALELARAYNDVTGMGSVSRGFDLFDPEKAPEDVREALQRSWDEGFFVPMETYDLMGKAYNRTPTQRKLSEATDTAISAVSIMFQGAERINRLVTYIAAHRIAQIPGVERSIMETLANNRLAMDELGAFTPEGFAEWVIDETHFRMGKVNRPTVARGLGAPILQFRGFTMQSLELWTRMMAQNGTAGKTAAATSILLFMVMAGLWGFPGADDLREGAERLYKLLAGRDLDVKTKVREFVYKLTGSPMLAQMFSKGVPSGFGLDLSGRVGMGNILPDSPLQVAGIPADIFIGRPLRFMEHASRGHWQLAAAELAPNFVKNILQANDWASSGVRSAATGKVVVPAEQVTTGDVAQKSIGFTPGRISTIREAAFAKRRTESAVDELRRDYYSKLATASAARTRAERAGKPSESEALNKEIQAIHKEIAEYNRGKPTHERIVINRETLKQRIRDEHRGTASKPSRRKAARSRSREIDEAYGLSPQPKPQEQR